MAKNEKGVSAKSPGNPYVLAPLASMMKVDFLFNDDGGVWLMHDKPLPAIMKWLEYDMDTQHVTLVMRYGVTQDLGLAIPVRMGQSLLTAQEVTAMLIDPQGKVADFAIVPLIARNTIN